MIEKLTIDFSNVQVGNNGNTSYYGGSYTITGGSDLVSVNSTVQCGGNDRGDNYQDDILSELERIGCDITEWSETNEYPEWYETIYTVTLEDWKVVSIEPKAKLMCSRHPDSKICSVRQAWESTEVYADGSCNEVTKTESDSDFYDYQCGEGCSYESYQDVLDGKVSD